MRILAIDLGERRVGLAISDVSGTLARPLETLTVASASDALDRVAAAITTLSQEADRLGARRTGVLASRSAGIRHPDSSWTFPQAAGAARSARGSLRQASSATRSSTVLLCG